MANSQDTSRKHAYVSIDTTPASGGYWTDPISPTKAGEDALFWSRRGTGLGSVTIQFRCPGDTDWTDYVTAEDLAIGERFRIDDKAVAVQWRTGIKEDTSADPLTVAVSGTTIVGFDW